VEVHDHELGDRVEPEGRLRRLIDEHNRVRGIKGDIVRRGRWGIAVGLAVAVVTLAGCSSGSSSSEIQLAGTNQSDPATTGGAASSGTTAGYPDPLTATAAAAGKIGPAPLLTTDQDGDLSVAWRLIGMSPDSGQLVLRYLAGGDGCVGPAGFRVKETAQSVTLTAVVRSPVAGKGCAVPQATGSGYLDLKAPLGERTLIHAEVDPAWTTLD
jgi:hypothetical protein